MNTDIFTLPISPNILNIIASGYKDLYRVLLEYPINAIDASSKFYNASTNSYTKNIIITITHKGKKAIDSEFIFDDNCEGFSSSIHKSFWENFNVGLSNKAGETQTIGKFGVGMMTFAAICNQLKISIKEKDYEKLGEITFSTSLFKKSGISGVPITFDETDYKGNINDSFTRVILSDFKPDKFKEFNFNEFKSELELHLDQILRRKNLVITLIDNKNKEHVCKPFDYDSIEGEPFERTITELKYMHYKRGRKEKTIQIAPNKVKIYFKVTRNRILEDRRLCFTDKGVRIDRISKFEEFRTNQKGLVWSHPNVVGYVDITGVVEPALTRDSFEPNENLKPLFYTLNKLEPEIKEYIESQMREAKTESIKKLELKLNDALKKFLEDKKHNARDTRRIKNNNSETEKIKVTLINGEENKLTTENDPGKKNSKLNENEGKGVKTDNNQKNLRELELQVPKEDTAFLENYIDRNDLFSLRIDDLNNPDEDEHHKPYRSKFTGPEVVIFQKHPSFQSKIDGTNGSQKISEGLVTYLASEIVMHYMVNFSDLLNHEGSLSQKVLSEFITTVYEFESYLKDLKGKDLSELAIDL